MIELGINVDHVATLRQQRGTIYPDPVEAALQAELAGADLITLHLREDRRHIQESDVFKIRNQILTRMNLECSLSKDILNIATDIGPNNVCLVPENRNEMTTEGGLQVSENMFTIEKAITMLSKSGIQTTLFIDPEPSQVISAAKIGASAVEIHTGFYEQSFKKIGKNVTKEILRIKKSVDQGLRCGIRVNAGHGLNYENVSYIANIDGISELNIGHAIVSKAIFYGWSNAIRDMKSIIIQSRKTFA